MLTNIQRNEDGSYVLDRGLGDGDEGAAGDDEIDVAVEAQMMACGPGGSAGVCNL